MTLVCDNNLYAQQIENICKLINFQDPNTYVFEKNPADCLVLDCENGGTIKYNTPVSIFYALGLLKQYNGKIKKTFTPLIENVSIMLDCSRNAVLSVQSVKKFLSYMAVMGVDSLMLYTEDTYEVDNYPYFGYMRGRYTYNELKELDDYAYSLGIEMFPCIQTLGNMKTPLRWNWMGDIKDTDNILLANEEKTYAFLEACIKAATIPFRSKKIHICMDEAYELGSGNYLNRFGYKQRKDIMKQHLDRVCDICLKYNLKPIMWGDMYAAMGSESKNAFDLSLNISDDIINSVNPNVTLVYWDYNNNSYDAYDKLMGEYKKFKNELIFAGAVHSWNGFSCHYARTFNNTSLALKVCHKHGVKNIMATIWGDNGAENYMFSNLLGILLFCEYRYQKEIDYSYLAQRFNACTNADFERFYSLSELELTPYTDEKNLSNSNPSKWLMYQDILLGLFDKHVENMPLLSEHYRKCKEKYLEYYKSKNNFNEVFLLPYLVASVLEIKCDIGVRLKKAYDEKNQTVLQKILNNDLPALKIRLKELINGHRELWYSTYKPFGYEVMDMRYGSILQRIDTAEKRLSDYLCGKIKNIAELEEERLYFSCWTNKDWPMIDVNDWDKIVSSSPM